MASVDNTRGNEFHQERFQLDKESPAQLVKSRGKGHKECRHSPLPECFEETVNLAEDLSTYG